MQMRCSAISQRMRRSLLWAPDGILKHPSIAQSVRGKSLFDSTLGLGHALDQPGTFSACCAATRRVAQAKTLRARLRKPLELSRARLTGWANSNHDDRRRSGYFSGSGEKRYLKESSQARVRPTRAARLRSARGCELVGAAFRFDSAFLRLLDKAQLLSNWPAGLGRRCRNR